MEMPLNMQQIPAPQTNEIHVANMPIAYTKQHDAKVIQNILQASQSVQALKDNLGIDDVPLELTLSCPIGTTYFSKFLKLEYNEENMQCWLELKWITEFCEEIGKQYTVALESITKERLNHIATTYIDNDAPFEINLPAKIKSQYLAGVAQFEAQVQTNTSTALLALRDAIEKLRSQLVTNMRDPYARYMDSPLFAELASVVISLGYQSAVETVCFKLAY